MPKTFGARLRQRREHQQIALSTIAEQTKISLPLLEGLERGDISHWPAGIFRRAFIRAYAVAIGLDPDATVREFLELYPDPVEATALPAAPQPDNFLSRLGFGVWPPRKRRTPEESAPVAPPVETSAPVRIPTPLPIVAPTTGAAPRGSDPLSAASPPPSPAQAPAQVDLLAVAQLCTEFGQVEGAREALPLLKEAATILDAVGLIVWIWDPKAGVLKPALAHGYPDKLLAQLPGVSADTDNATAAAFREARPRVVSGSELSSSALVVPLMTPGGCAGVLAIELPHRREQEESTLALATIFAAQVARWIRAARPAKTAGRRTASTSASTPASATNVSPRPLVQ
ncbi:MAG TPA: helix-turn-helix domain-containing protein [Vicinamibacterales bacterium]|nr:helix-turn-helix domain-containing protein [Vicinamibacterales bacterium]